MRVIPIHPVSHAAAPSERLSFQVPPPLALYIHVPWCVEKCPYCDFNSHALPTAGVPEAEYVAALVADLESALPLIWGRPVVSVFLGGGTPSLLSPDALAELFAQIRMRLKILPGAEITLEANPGTVDAARFAGFKAAGVNRLSIGIQSFDARHLQSIGRIHGREEALSAAANAAACFDRFNLDLMYGLPGQTLSEALLDVQTALSFAPTHLSCYQLTLEPNTRFAAFPPELPDEDLCADMQEEIEAALAAAGFAHYETSAFARPGAQCQHNLNYWQFGDYLGIGAGAHSKLTQHDRVFRQMRWKHPDAYLAAALAGRPVQTESSISATDLPGEFLMNALRLVEGFEPALFTARTAQPWSAVLPTMLAAKHDGLLEMVGGQVRPTLRGQRFLNVLLARFLGESDDA